jgi:branched-chain amino acid transport system substrate-binding protein
MDAMEERDNTSTDRRGIPLASADGLWFIEKGEADIYTVPYEQGKAAGIRTNLVVLETGQFVFPLPPIPAGDREYRFFADVVGDGLIRPVTAEDLVGRLAGNPMAVAAGIDGTVMRLSAAMREGDYTGNTFLRTKSGEKGRCMEGAGIVSGEDVLWLSLDSGSVFYGGRRELKTVSGATVPVTPDVFVEVGQAADVRVEGTLDYIKKTGTLPDLMALCRLFAKAAVLAMEQKEKERQDVLARRKKEDDGKFSDSLTLLSAVMEPKGKILSLSSRRPSLKREHMFWALLAFLVVFCLAWFGELIHLTARNWKLRRQAATYRAEVLRNYEGPIRIGVAAVKKSAHDETYWNGIRFAVEEINRNGGVLSRKIELVERNDKGQADEARIIAQEFADDMTISAVIGHRFSDLTLSTAIIYEYYGLLMICPRTTSPLLTSQGYRRVFRTNLSGTNYGHQMADFSKKMGYRRIAVIYIDDAFGKGVANAFEVRADTLSLAIVDRTSHGHEVTTNEIARKMENLHRNREFDALVLVTVMKFGPEFIKIARAAGIKEPLILHEALDSENLIEQIGEKNCGEIYIASMFHPDYPFAKARPFAEMYQRKYGQIPNGLAAQGYDTVGILAEAMRRARSIVPDDIAETFRTMPEWQGATGPHKFTPEGDMMKPLQFKTIRNGRFVPFNPGNAPLDDTFKSVP